MTDFELASINALENVYNNVNQKQCLFHLSENAFANIQSKHLHASYENEDARMTLRCLPALAFLPVCDVGTGFDEVKNVLIRMQLFYELHLENNLLEYLSYFERTYVRRRVRGVQTDGLFPVACWNCNAAALDGMPKTNNAMEGWHKGFNARFRKAHMSLSQFIIRLKAQEEKTRQMVVRARFNPAEVLRQVRRHEYVRREANLKMLVEGFHPGQKMEFLDAVQHHLAKFPFVRQNEINQDPISESFVEM